MAKVAFKTMQLDDLDEVTQIEQRIYDFPWSRKNFQDSIESGYLCTCMWLDGVIAGYSVRMMILEECHLLNISVSMDWQGQGWGKYLLDWCQNDARTIGATGMLLEVRPSNTVARHIYDKVGFKLIGVRKNYYPSRLGREDAIVMFKQLVISA